MIEALNIDTSKEKIYYVDDTLSGLPFEIQDQAQGLTELLSTGELTDIKIVGHSEGAAATAVVLDQLANDNSYLANTNVRNQLTAAFLLDAPTGISDFFVRGPSINRAYHDLPAEVHAHPSMREMKMADIWNTASIVHSPGQMSGWEYHSYSYDSRSWVEKAFSFSLSFLCPGPIPGYSYSDIIGTAFKYHGDPLASDYTIDVIKNLLGQ